MTRYKTSLPVGHGIAQDYQAKRGGVRERAIAQRQAGHRIGICVPVLGEHWSGVECSSSRERNLAALRQALATLIIWPYTNDAAEEFGRVFAELKRAGRPMQQIDIQIGAIARTPAQLHHRLEGFGPVGDQECDRRKLSDLNVAPESNQLVGWHAQSFRRAW